MRTFTAPAILPVAKHRDVVSVAETIGRGVAFVGAYADFERSGVPLRKTDLGRITVPDSPVSGLIEGMKFRVEDAVLGPGGQIVLRGKLQGRNSCQVELWVEIDSLPADRRLIFEPKERGLPGS